MRIGFTGTYSVGKTSLVKDMATWPELEGYHFATERSKYLRDMGIPLNTDSTILGQTIFAAERASELLKENVVTDRTVWDVSAFTYLSKTIRRYQKPTLIQACMMLSRGYDYVFYVSPKDVPIEDNGVRETDPVYRLQVDKQIRGLLQAYKPRRLIYVGGTHEERIEIIKKALGFK